MSGGASKRVVDTSTYVELTRPVHARLFQAAVALCGDRDMAADLTQDALVKGYLAFERFRPDAPVYPWLARILKNVFLDQVRSAPARREQPMPEALDPESGGPGPLDELVAAERARIVHEAIARLPPDFALVITLVDLQGLDYADAAAVLELPVGTVRSRLSRARTRLRKLLLARPEAAVLRSG
ncbi:MAG: RNA polymerase sigma factor [Oligoflexia bacterium]|nr:RNA polymerase sigma factor [Oligoflexia bacterium]